MDNSEKQTFQIAWVTKALLGAYAMTGILLLLLTLLVYKFELDETNVKAGIAAIYVLSAFVGGTIVGKLTKVRRFLWGMLIGVLYFGVLLLLSLGIYRTLQGSGAGIFTSLLLCAGGGMAGGMVS